MGSHFDRGTGFHYHIHTDSPNLLPKRFIESGFENLSFIPGVNCVELPSFGHYRVFERKIPTAYPITNIRVGFEVHGTITWRFFFAPDTITH